MTPLGIAALVLAYVVVGHCTRRLVLGFCFMCETRPFLWWESAGLVVMWPMAIVHFGSGIPIDFESWRRKSERKERAPRFGDEAIRFNLRIQELRAAVQSLGMGSVTRGDRARHYLEEDDRRSVDALAPEHYPEKS